MHIGTIIMVIGILAMLMMPLVFAYMWVQIRIKINDKDKEKSAERTAVKILMYVELNAVIWFIAGSYFKHMVSLQFAVIAITSVIAAIYMFKRMISAAEAKEAKLHTA